LEIRFCSEDVGAGDAKLICDLRMRRIPRGGTSGGQIGEKPLWGGGKAESGTRWGREVEERTQVGLGRGGCG
jgi:hypothetical protein